jgi:hypothetical protein
MIVVAPTGGLCNKLRVSFSYWEYAKFNNKNLTVIWETCEACPGFFLDYFEPVNGITFLKENSENLQIDYKGYSCEPNFNSNIKFLYTDLKLQSRIQDSVNEKLKVLGDFIAIQVRRTDHEEMAKSFNRFTTDEDFCKFIDDNPNGNLFVTADNKKSFDFFKERYSDRLILEYPADDPTKYRHTSLEDSIVDMLICTYATVFKQSDFSSFGDTIRQLRKSSSHLKF